MNLSIRSLTSCALGVMLLAPTVTARDRPARSESRQSVNRSGNMDRNANRNVDRNVNQNVDRNANRNVNNQNVRVDRDVNNVNVDRDVNVYGGGNYNRGCCYNGGGWGTAAAVATTAMVTAAVVGSAVNTLPPSCSMVQVNGVAYQQCGSTWYQPQFSGGNTTYVVVNSPQ